MRLNSDGNIPTDNTSLNAGEITPSDNVDNAREWSQHDPAVVLVAAADHVHQPMATEKERARSPRYAQTHRGTRALTGAVRCAGAWSLVGETLCGGRSYRWHDRFYVGTGVPLAQLTGRSIVDSGTLIGRLPHAGSPKE
ncbi:MAG: hypothetical protein IH941_04500 [Acidobacteria bacterium]|nr:hypothetical protein [Acidobacteriota bacterium]